MVEVHSNSINFHFHFHLTHLNGQCKYLKAHYVQSHKAHFVGQNVIHYMEINLSFHSPPFPSSENWHLFFLLAIISHTKTAYIYIKYWNIDDANAIVIIFWWTIFHKNTHHIERGRHKWLHKETSSELNRTKKKNYTEVVRELVVLLVLESVSMSYVRNLSKRFQLEHGLQIWTRVWIYV